MNRILSFDELRVAQHNKTRKLVIAFAYDIELGEAICGNMILSTRSFQLKQIPLHLLTFYNLKDTNDLISDEKDISGDLKGGIGYLTHVGINRENWNKSWGMFDWASLEQDGSVKVYRQKMSAIPPP